MKPHSGFRSVQKALVARPTTAPKSKQALPGAQAAQPFAPQPSPALPAAKKRPFAKKAQC